MTNEEWKKIKYFTPSEFICKCGKCGQGAEEASFELFTRLELARKDAGTPFVIGSGFRCAAYNTSVDGVDDSAHMYGYAVDIITSNSVLRFKILSALFKHFDRIGIYKSFIHVDVDPKKPAKVAFIR